MKKAGSPNKRAGENRPVKAPAGRSVKPPLVAGAGNVYRNSVSMPVRYDAGLLLSVLFLVGCGIVMVYSASSALALGKFGNDAFFLKRQVLFALLGIAALVICSHLPYRFYRLLVYPLLLTSLALLLAVKLSSLSVTAGGSSRWLRLGPFNFQPVELARLALVFYMAYSLSKKEQYLDNFSVGFLPHLIVLVLFTGLLLLQPDFGSVMIFCALAWTMMFVAGVRLKYLFGCLLGLVPLAAGLILAAPYRMKRLVSFVDPWRYPTEGGYQVIHSMLAFGTGGLWGTGIGQGYQKLFYLPEPHTDFIFSVIGEEVGLLGVLVILIAYGVIIWRGFAIGRRSRDSFASLAALGITAAIGLQVAVNMGVALGMLPTKGLTLPFLSYGGSSLIINMAAVGILMNIGAANGAGV